MISIATDVAADVMYVQLAKGRVARTIEFDDDTFVDVDAHGNPLGIEVLHPNRAWPLPEILERFQIADETRALLLQIADVRVPSIRGMSVDSGSAPLHLALAL